MSLVTLFSPRRAAAAGRRYPGAIESAACCQRGLEDVLRGFIGLVIGIIIPLRGLSLLWNSLAIFARRRHKGSWEPQDPRRGRAPAERSIAGRLRLGK
jgi:hypothetical protein